MSLIDATSYLRQPMLPFATGGTCPKCASNDYSVAFAPEGMAVETNLQGNLALVGSRDTPPHLVRICETCGFAQAMSPADASLPRRR